MKPWVFKLRRFLGLKITVDMLVGDMSEAENEAINIYNAWNFGFMDRATALSCFTEEMLEDRKAKNFYNMIWKRDECKREN